MRTENTGATAAENNPVDTAETRDDVATTANRATAGTDTDGRRERPTGPVWDALTANPGSSVAAIAAAAGATRATARRVLTELESAGHATRTPGGRDGGRRAPDAWHPTATDAVGPTAERTDATTADGTDATTADDPAAPHSDTAPTPDTGGAEATATHAESVATAPDTGEAAADQPVEGLDAASVEAAGVMLTALDAAVRSASKALSAGDRTAALEAAEVIYAGSGKARRLIRTAANGRPRTSSGRPGFLRGELRAKVAAHLRAFPEAEFTPYEIGKVLDRSSGAIANALDKLVELGEAVEVCERPRRFSAAPGTSHEGAAAAPATATA